MLDSLAPDLPWSLKDLESMVSKASFVLFHLKTYTANIRILSPDGKKVLEDLARRLERSFPSELAFNPNEAWGVAYPMSIQLKREAGKLILSMKHRARYSEKDTLLSAIPFLLQAKMIETGFPGIMIENEKETEHAFAEIAHTIKERYFPGRDVDLLGRVYPYPVYKVNKEGNELERAIYGALGNFYRQELLARLCPNPYDTAGELYETIFYEALLPTDRKSPATMIDEVALVSLESKLNYTRKWAMFPGFISHDFEKLAESRGAALLLDVLKLRWGKEVVEKLYWIFEQLPLDSSGGFSPNVLAIDHVVRQLHTFLKEGESRKEAVKQPLDRPSSMLELTWPFGGTYGEIKLEKGPPIAFL